MKLNDEKECLSYRLSFSFCEIQKYKETFSAAALNHDRLLLNKLHLESMLKAVRLGSTVHVHIHEKGVFCLCHISEQISLFPS
jgi:hypothetical protein